MSPVGRRAGRRQALFLLYQWDLTGQPLASLYEGEPDPFASGLAATHVSLAIACHAMWATALDLMRRWFVAPWTRRALQAATGIALIALAIRVLV